MQIPLHSLHILEWSLSALPLIIKSTKKNEFGGLDDVFQEHFNEMKKNKKRPRLQPRLTYHHCQPHQPPFPVATDVIPDSISMRPLLGDHPIFDVGC